MTEKANIIDKMSLYDLLTLIIPGSMVVGTIYVGVYPWIKSYTFSWIIGVAAIGVMYLIGLLLKNWSIAKDTDRFDKCISDVKVSYKRFADKIKFQMDCRSITYDDYYKDYYFAIENHGSSKVAILEAQVAFLRTMRYTMKVLFYIFIAFFVLNVGQLCTTSSIFWLTGAVLTCGVATSEYFIKLAHTIQQKVYEGVIYDSYYLGGPISKRINNEKQI